jgi:hypothetical protein
MAEPLTQEQILQILKDEKWNVDDPDSLQDMIHLVKAIEKAHGIEPREGWHLEWVPDSESWPN